MFPELTKAFFSAGCGLLVFLLSILHAHDRTEGTGLALDFWMAAGLLHLSSTGTWKAIVISAVTILIRKIVVVPTT